MPAEADCAITSASQCPFALPKILPTAELDMSGNDPEDKTWGEDKDNTEIIERDGGGRSTRAT